MTETAHTRSRRAALAGLILQVITTGGALVLSVLTSSTAFGMLAWYLAGGIPIWFVALLVFRQHELAALERMDLEELRREKAAVGGEAIFESEGGVGLLVAQTRLDWMRKWLVPGFGLASALFLIGAGIGAWVLLSKRGPLDWAPLQRQPIGLVLSSLVLLVLFFYGRYAAGMARVREWQLLRGCGSYMLGTAVATLAVVVALAANVYSKDIVSWERTVAFAIPVLMVLLGVETLINFLLDFYRPRSPGVEPRACFDSRLLGLLSEPGGIAHSLAEAINYQFGFQVSQTWFYQLLQRAFIPLVLVGALAVWAMSCFVVVQPYERAIIERFGRQIDPEHPLEPGLHFKWPAPIEIARLYNTDQLYEVYIGYRDFDQPSRKKNKKSNVELWTDQQHAGRDHFDFVISPTPLPEDKQVPQSGEQRTAEHLARLVVVVQYKLDPQRLAAFTQNLRDPHRALRDIAWNEVVQYVAAHDIDQLLGVAREKADRVLRGSIAERVREAGLGLDVEYVGLLQVHPTREVAKAFREVITAQQEKIAQIRTARVTENETLSRVAGDKQRALALSYAIEQVHKNELRRNTLDQQAREKHLDTNVPAEIIDTLADPMRVQLRAAWRLELARQRHDRFQQDFDLGLGGSLSDLKRTAAEVARREAEFKAADAAFTKASRALRERLTKRYDAATVAFWFDLVRTRVALAFWADRLEEGLKGLEGKAAVTLAEAQAERWQLEMGAAAEVALLQNERYTYAANPKIYRARSYIQVLTDGIKEARKYLMAFKPDGRKVHVRLEAQEQANPDIVNIPTSAGE